MVVTCISVVALDRCEPLLIECHPVQNTENEVTLFWSNRVGVFVCILVFVSVCLWRGVGVAYVSVQIACNIIKKICLQISSI